MALIVQKFGGSSVADAERLANVARIITDIHKAGNKVVVVVSAQGDTTDDLIAKAAEVNEHASRRETDALLSAGEQMSSALLAMAIQKLGCPAVSLLGWQVGIRSSSNHSNARIDAIETERLERELDYGNIVIVAGFQGINRVGDITTLGRGASDTTAVALAAVMRAEKCQIFTDVDGVYTADPRIVPQARKLREITYDEMLELASLGAQVLCNRAVEMAKKYNIEVEVLSSLNPIPGTMVKEVATVEKMLIKGIARDNHVSRISLVGLPDIPGIAFKVFSRLGRNDINIDIILQSIGRNGTKDITFTIAHAQADEAVELLREPLTQLGAKEILRDDNVSKISIVGAGMESHPGVAAQMFEALADAGVNIQMIATSEIKISVLIDQADSEKAIIAVHNAFMQ